MHRWAFCFILALFLMVSPPALRAAHDVHDSKSPQTSSAAKAPAPLMEYHSTGGFIGVDNHAVLDASGNFTFRDRLGATSHLHLDGAEMADLQKKFADWKEIAASYHSPGAVPDALEWTISYRGVPVTVAQSDAHIPASFLAAKAAIEKLIERAK